MEIVADKLSYENEAFYLWGYNTDLNEVQYIRVDRIKEIKAIKIQDNKLTTKLYGVKYKLKGQQALMFIQNTDETIIEKNGEEIIVEAKIQSKFKFVQRALSFGSSCTVISPEHIKKEVLSKLKATLNIYKQSDII